MKSIKAVPFIDTLLNEEYRKFINQFFTVELFSNSFKGWKTFDEGSVAKFISSSDKSTIEFFGEGVPYKITNPKLVGDKTFLLPYPKNLDQFICDCERCSVDLHWNSAIVGKFERKCLMKQSELQIYYTNLLDKLGKNV